MTEKISWDEWSRKVRERIQTTRTALGSFFHVSMEERKVSIVFIKNGAETNVGHACLQFDRDRATAKVMIDADYLSQMGLVMSFEIDEESGMIDASRLVLQEMEDY